MENKQEDNQETMRRWQEAGHFRSSDTSDSHKKYYCLDMFPYPSGSGLHVGHIEGYAATDILSRYKRMKGFSVLHPIGWDAFGLPAENYAIKTGVHPSRTTDEAIATFKRQMNSLGLSYDWEREIQTSKPDYYRWTQWFFLLMYKNGLAYKKKGSVNWCESCQTVLANEQAEDGVCERCGSQVIQKDLEQWYFKITDFIENSEGQKGETKGLIDGLATVDWPDSTIAAQKNWIGRSEGVEFELAINNSSEKIKAYTTRIDTVYGLTYVVLAPEHELVEKLPAKNREELSAYVGEVKKRTELERMENKDKSGVELKGVTAINPFNGEAIPVYIADYVLANYGTGAVMAVPAHDERDYLFAKKYGLPIRAVIAKDKDADAESWTGIIESEGAYCDDGILLASAEFTGLDSASARTQMAERLESEGRGQKKVNYKLRDWLVSRQRYWGAPIPIVYCDLCGEVAVPEADLPVALPMDVDFKPTGESPLAGAESFYSVPCPKCGAPARRECDTMDTFVCSSWYYFRYIDNNNSEVFAGSEEIKKYLPVDVYVGGAEHSVLHLLYARFFTKVLHRLGYIDFDEPFRKLRHQGIILAPDGSKMSKSKGNVVNPDDVVSSYGPDALRLHEMFLGAFEDMKPWNTKTISGVKRFLDKTIALAKKVSPDTDLELSGFAKLERELHRSIKKVSADIEDFKFNTAISQLMILVNEMGQSKRIPKSYYEKFLTILAPFAPFTAEEAWGLIGNTFSVHQESWPDYNEALTQDNEVNVAVQVNGKLRGTVRASVGTEQEAAIALVQSDLKLSAYVAGGYKKVIFVKDRILNFIV